MAILSKAALSKPSRVQPATRAKLRLLQSADLKRVPWLVHGFTTCPGGFTTSYGGRSLNLGFTKDDLRASVERNRKAALLAAGAATKGKPWPLITLRQVHSDMIHVVRSRRPEKFVGDGVVTDLRGAWRSNSYRRLLPGPARGYKEESCGRVSCRMARDGEAHRGKRRGHHAAGIRFASGRYSCGDWAGNPAMLV